MDKEGSSETSSNSSVSDIERIPDQKKILKELKEDFEEAKVAQVELHPHYVDSPLGQKKEGWTQNPVVGRVEKAGWFRRAN